MFNLVVPDFNIKSGNLGYAILKGLLAFQLTVPLSSEEPPSSLSAGLLPIISHFIATVKSVESLQQVTLKLASVTKVKESPSVEVWQEQRNLEAIELADIVLLSCQSSEVAGILSVPGVRAALSGKLLLSVCLGISTPKLVELLDLASMERACTIVYAMPNTASKIQQSSTTICRYASDPELSPTISKLVNNIFSSIGAFTVIPEHLMTAATVTAASSPAFFALALEGVIEGAVAKGMPREKATIMAAQAMKGTAELVLRGEDPKVVMREVMTPKGCSEKGVHVLQNGGVYELYVESVRVSTEMANEMERCQ